MFVSPFGLKKKSPAARGTLKLGRRFQSELDAAERLGRHGESWYGWFWINRWLSLTKENKQQHNGAKKNDHVIFGVDVLKFLSSNSPPKLCFFLLNVRGHLLTLTLGFEFNRPLPSLPETLQRLSFGDSFNQSLEDSLMKCEHLEELETVRFSFFVAKDFVGKKRESGFVVR